MTIVTDGGGEVEGDADFGLLLFVVAGGAIIIGVDDGHFVGGGHYVVVCMLLCVAEFEFKFVSLAPLAVLQFVSE